LIFDKASREETRMEQKPSQFSDHLPVSCDVVIQWSTEEIIADNLKRAGWSLGWVSAIDREGRTIWIVDAHRDDGKRFVVHADEKLTAFLELESAICACSELFWQAGKISSKLGVVNGSESGGGHLPR
jgi:hypothetical protein